jgi:hypothetical protein
VLSLAVASISYRFIELPWKSSRIKNPKRSIGLIFLSLGTLLGAALVLNSQRISETTSLSQYGNMAAWELPFGSCLILETNCLRFSKPTNNDILLVGDSHARGLALGFGAAADSLRLSWSAEAAIGCTFARFIAGGQFDFCDAWVEKTMRKVLASQPELAVMFQCNRIGVGCPQPNMSAEQRDEYVAGVASVIGELNDAGIAVLYVSGTPAVLPEQASPSLILNSSRVPIQRGAIDTNRKVAEQLQQTADASGGLLQLAEITSGLCNKESCRYVSSDNQPLWFDTDHLSLYGVRDRTEPLRIQIERALDNL